jgi:hypothetical protein
MSHEPAAPAPKLAPSTAAHNTRRTAALGILDGIPPTGWSQAQWVNQRARDALATWERRPNAATAARMAEGLRAMLTVYGDAQ